MLVEKMTKQKTILKFDTGADGFMMMIYCLAGFAAALLAFGVYFIVVNF